MSGRQTRKKGRRAAAAAAEPPVNRSRRRVIIGTGLVAALAVAIVAAVLTLPDAAPPLPALPAPSYEEQPDGARRVLLEPEALAAFCEAHGLPVPPDFNRLDGVLTQIIYQRLAQIAANPADAAPYGELGDIYQAHEYPDHALACYRRAMQVGDRFEWHYQTAAVHLSQGRTDEAIDAWRETTRLNPAYAATYYHLAEQLAQAGELDDAAAAYRRFSTLATGDPAGLIGLAEIARQRDNDEEALKHLQAAIKRNPNDPRIHFQLAQLHRRKGNVESAERHYGIYQASPKRAHLADPLKDKIRWTSVTPAALGDIVHDLSLQGRRDDALEFGLEELKRRPRNAHLMWRVARVYNHLGEHDKATALVEQSLQLVPGDYHALCVLAEIRLSTGHLETAVELANQAIAADPSRDVAYWIKAQSLRRLGRLDDAIPAYDEAARRAPDNFVNAVSLGDALHQAERWTEARDAYQRALTAKVGDPYALARLRELETQLDGARNDQDSPSAPGRPANGEDPDEPDPGPGASRP